MLKKTIWSVALLLIATLCFPRSQGFTLKKISGMRAADPRYATDGIPKEIRDKTYRYLGSGKECYAFVSDDDRTVIKFFKQKHITPKWWHLACPSLFEEKIQRRRQLREKCFNSYWIAYRDLQDMTGVIYLHLNQSEKPGAKTRFFDPKGDPFDVDLSRFQFIVQQKATPLLSYIQQCLSQGHSHEAQKIVAELPLFIEKRRERGVIDSDLNCERNLGVLEGKIISIDIGEFQKGISERTLDEEVREAVADLQRWMDAFCPQLNSNLSEKKETQS